MKLFKSVLLVGFSCNLLFFDSALAEKSDANDFCNYMNGLVFKYGTNLNAELMTELSKHTYDIVTWQNIAIKSKLKFEDFQKLFFENVHSKIPDSYKGSYIKAYANFYCGSGKTEAGVSPEKGKPLSSGQYLNFAKEPKVESHPYYNDSKNTR